MEKRDRTLLFFKKFLGFLIFRGNKKYAINFLDSVCLELKNKLKLNPVMVLDQAIKNMLPPFAIGKLLLGRPKKNKKRRFKYIPMEITWKKKVFFVMKWFISLKKHKRGRPFIKGVYLDEVVKSIIEAYHREGRIMDIKAAYLGLGKEDRYKGYRKTKEFTDEMKLMLKDKKLLTWEEGIEKIINDEKHDNLFTRGLPKKYIYSKPRRIVFEKERLKEEKLRKNDISSFNIKYFQKTGNYFHIIDEHENENYVGKEDEKTLKKIKQNVIDDEIKKGEKNPFSVGQTDMSFDNFEKLGDDKMIEEGFFTKKEKKKIWYDRFTFEEKKSYKVYRIQKKAIERKGKGFDPNFIEERTGNYVTNKYYNAGEAESISDRLFQEGFEKNKNNKNYKNYSKAQLEIIKNRLFKNEQDILRDKGHDVYSYINLQKYKNFNKYSKHN